MHLRCPHCRNPIELGDETRLTEVICPSCGSSFNLISGDTTASFHETIRTIGHFELVEHVGIGQFGSVWKARDTELDRTVALKIPRVETLDPKRRELFFREARAAAQLRHENIISVHEVGREDSTVYIVSDFVDGANLAEWLSAKKPSPREAAELCIQIAEALHHAHEAGIVHRDLKPGNVMMDSEGKPSIMDFGLAKREAGEVTMTMQGQILGTPAYMPPEQARGEAHTVDCRADVYSLGVMLFEMLTGELPFRGEKRMQIVQILNDDPPQPRRLNAHIPRDVETICLKCLEKNPERRYQTARGLAEDLQRFVNGEPITARPVGRLERGWRWCKRNTALATVGAIALLLLLTLSIGGPIVALHQVDLRQDAEHERARADAEAERATESLAAEQEAVRKLSESLEDNEKTIYQWVEATKNKELLKDPRFKPVLKEFLKQALAYHERFVEQHKGDQDPKMRARIARALFEVAYINAENGSNDLAIAAYQRVLAVCKPLARETEADPDHQQLHSWAQQRLSWTYNNVANLYQHANRHSEALTAYHKGLEIDKLLTHTDPKSVQYRREIGTKHHNIGNLHARLNQPDAALVEYQKALAIREQLVRELPKSKLAKTDLATTHYVLGIVYGKKGLIKEARAALDKAFEIRKELVANDPSPQSDFQSDLASSHESMAFLHQRDGKLREALAAHRVALKIRTQLVQDNPTVTNYRYSLANSHFKIGSLLRQMGSQDAAQAAFDRAQEIWERLVREEPNTYANHVALAETYRVKGEAFHRRGAVMQAVTEFQTVLKIRRRLALQFPGLAKYQYALARSLERLGIIYRTDLSNPEQALPFFREAISILERLVRKNGDVSLYENVLGNNLLQIGFAYESLGNTRDAAAAFEKSYAVRQRLLQEKPTPARYRLLHNACNYIAKAAERTNRREDAIARWRAIAEIGARLVREHPDVVDYERTRATAFHRIGDVYLRARDGARALAAYGQALPLRKRLASDNPEHKRDQGNLHWTYWNQGKAYRLLGKDEEEFKVLQESIGILDQLRHTDAALIPVLERAYSRIGQLHRDAGKFDKAAAAIRKAITLSKKPAYESYAFLAVVYLKFDRFDSARDALAKAIDIGGKWRKPVLFEMSEAELRDDLKTLQRYRTKHAEDRGFDWLQVDRSFRLAVLLRTDGRMEEANGHFQSALDSLKRLPKDLLQSGLVSVLPTDIKAVACEGTNSVSPRFIGAAALPDLLTSGQLPRSPDEAWELIVAASQLPSITCKSSHWKLTGAVNATGLVSGQFRPDDGCLYFGRLRRGVYKLTADGRIVSVAEGRVAAVAVEPQTGDIYFGEYPPEKGFYKISATTGKKRKWLSTFSASAGHPTGIAFPTSSYKGHLLSGKQGMVVDISGSAYRFSTEFPNRIEASYSGKRTKSFVRPHDVTIGRSGTFVAAAGNPGRGGIFRLLDNGTFDLVRTVEPLVKPTAVATDPLTGDLILQEYGIARIVRLDLKTGKTTVLFDKVQTTWTGVDVSPDGNHLVLTFSGAILHFRRVPTVEPVRPLPAAPVVAPKP